jgi:hypothetical protein
MMTKQHRCVFRCLYSYLFGYGVLSIAAIALLGGCAVNATPPPHCAADAARVSVNPTPPAKDPSDQPLKTTDRGS